MLRIFRSPIKSVISKRSDGVFTPVIDYLLDDYPGAAGAYSLRRLSSTYEGDAIRVRRSSDNAEQDIGFVGEDLDTASLLSFVGAGNGFVTVWYDQSGSVNNATQSTAGAQPQIVDSGSVVMVDGNPALDFNGKWVRAGITQNQPFTSLVVHKFDTINAGSTTGNDIFDGNTNGGDRTLLDLRNGNYRFFAGATFETSVAASTNNALMYVFWSNTSSQYALNNASLATVGSSIGGGDIDGELSIGYTNNPNFLGKMQEILIYDGDKAGDRTELNSNINNHYSIY